MNGKVYELSYKKMPVALDLIHLDWMTSSIDRPTYILSVDHCSVSETIILAIEKSMCYQLKSWLLVKYPR